MRRTVVHHYRVGHTPVRNLQVQSLDKLVQQALVDLASVGLKEIACPYVATSAVRSSHSNRWVELTTLVPPVSTPALPTVVSVVARIEVALIQKNQMLPPH